MPAQLPHDFSQGQYVWPYAPLKILHLSDFFFDSKLKSPSQFQTAGKLNNGFIRNGHHLIPFPYREIGRRGMGKYFSPLRQKQIEKTLKDFIRSACPDLLILGSNVSLSAQCLETIKETQKEIKIAQWSTDALFEGQNVRRLETHHPFCEASFVSTAASVTKKILAVEKGIYFLPNPVDLSVETGRNFRQEVLGKDIFLSCGNPKDKREIFGKTWEMSEFLYFLLENLPQKVRFSLAGLGGRPYASGQEYAEIVRAAGIGLNISRSVSELLYSSDRMSHIIGNGLLCAQERLSGFEAFFSEEELLFFSSETELIEKLIYFINHPKQRQKAAKKGWEKYVTLFNEQAVADYIVRASLGILKPKEHSWHLLA